MKKVYRCKIEVSPSYQRPDSGQNLYSAILSLRNGSMIKNGQLCLRVPLTLRKYARGTEFDFMHSFHLDGERFLYEYRERDRIVLSALEDVCRTPLAKRIRAKQKKQKGKRKYPIIFRARFEADNGYEIVKGSHGMRVVRGRRRNNTKHVPM